MKLTNNKIYSYANALLQEFSGSADLKLPIKINFYLQKNMQLLKTLALEIENSRLEIIKNYGELTEDGVSYVIPREKAEDAQRDLKDLFALEQEVQIYTININDLSNDLVLSMSQMEALMFMID